MWRMTCDGGGLPVEIAKDAGALVSMLQADGWSVREFRYDAVIMGNWYVDLVREGCYLRLVRDRSQFMVSGPAIEELKRAGLWNAFDDSAKFYKAVANWALNRPCV